MSPRRGIAGDLLPNPIPQATSMSHRPRSVSGMRFGFVGLVSSFVASYAAAAEPRTGEQIYRELCVRCHGKAGEGVKTKYAKPLIGDRSLADLTKLIDT